MKNETARAALRRRARKEGRKMPKMKTKAGAKKRFRTTATGKIRCQVAYKRHGMRKRPQKMKRKARGSRVMSAADSRIILRNFLRNG